MSQQKRKRKALFATVIVRRSALWEESADEVEAVVGATCGVLAMSNLGKLIIHRFFLEDTADSDRISILLNAPRKKADVVSS